MRYRLLMPEPRTHLFRVELRLTPSSAGIELRMPSWTPGSYLLREFPRHVQEFSAGGTDGRTLPWRKLDKNSWLIEAPAGAELVARYAVYANELSVRTSHLDASHGYVNGASVFMWAPSLEAGPVRLDVEPPAGWKVTTTLPEAGEPGSFRAAGYHQLVDSPLEIGTHAVVEFEAGGKPHSYAIWGRGDYRADRLITDTRALIDYQRGFWGGLPYDRYTFFLHLLPGGRGGLEHRESCSLHADPGAFRGDDYERFLALVTHEFFHTWNGTRIRPAPLAQPDYTRENYTRNLWVVEGLTTYYTDLFLCRSGLIRPERYLERLSDMIQRFQQLPGRWVQSLAESSFDAWIKFYRPDEHTPNAQVSYYQKGALVGLLLDMRIRRATGNRRCLDDVMRMLWARFGAADAGFPEEPADGIQAIAEEVCGEPLDEFFARHVLGTGELPFADALQVVGLRLTAGSKPLDPATRFGLRLQEQAGRVMVTHVRAGSAAYRAGVDARDELIGLDGTRVDLARAVQRLESATAGDAIRLALGRRGELIELDATIAEDVGPLALERMSGTTAEQESACRSWLEPQTAD